ncbi:MAG: hypothetical protein WCQ72_06685 [Eubacteriales bacterium]
MKKHNKLLTLIGAVISLCILFALGTVSFASNINGVPGGNIIADNGIGSRNSDVNGGIDGDRQNGGANAQDQTPNDGMNPNDNAANNNGGANNNNHNGSDGLGANNSPNIPNDNANTPNQDIADDGVIDGDTQDDIIGGNTSESTTSAPETTAKLDTSANSNGFNVAGLVIAIVIAVVVVILVILIIPKNKDKK